MDERGVSVVDGELDPLLEHHPQDEGVVLNVDHVDQGGNSHLTKPLLFTLILPDVLVY